MQNMTIFKTIGSRFRRLEDRHESDVLQDATNAAPPVAIAQTAISAKLLGAPLEESPDLYYEDRALGNSIHALEDVRMALRELTNAANEHKDMLVASANTERSLGDALADVMEPRRFASAHDEDDEPQDEFADLHFSQPQRRQDENSPAAANHFTNYLPIEAKEAQKGLGKGLAIHSDATIKLSVALSSPINDLTRSFEERYTRKIVPLRRRYMDQKGQYLKYKRNVDMAESDEKRSYYEALAEAAKPVWMRTSTELRTESDVMTELTAKNMAKWSRSLALQHERALAIAAANFADAFNRAKTLPSLSRTAK